MLAADQAQKRTRVHDSDALVLFERQEIGITRHDKCRAPLERCGQILIVVRVHACRAHLVVAGHPLREEDDILEPQFRMTVPRTYFRTFAYVRARSVFSTISGESTISNAASRKNRSITRPGGPSGRMMALT